MKYYMIHLTRLSSCWLLAYTNEFKSLQNIDLMKKIYCFNKKIIKYFLSVLTVILFNRIKN